MAQGVGNLQRKAKSGGAAKKKQLRKASLTKGKKQFTAKKKAVLSNGHFEAEQATTKTINQRNEARVAAKAISSGTLASQFFLKDLATKGTTEQASSLRRRSKKESKEISQTDRLKKQIKKLGKDV